MPTPVFYSGNGGYFQKSGLAANKLATKEWTLKKNMRVTDATNSQTAGYALPKGTVKESSGTAKIIWDALNSPESTAVGMDIGVEGTLTMKLGASTKKFTVPALITEITYRVDNQNGLVEYDTAWQGQGPVSGPA